MANNFKLLYVIKNNLLKKNKQVLSVTNLDGHLVVKVINS